MTRTQTLMTAADVAKILGVTRYRVNQLANRRRDFPRPAVVSRNAAGGVSGRFWRAADIEAWNATADRSPGRRAQPKAEAADRHAEHESRRHAGLGGLRIPG